jgi:hypothetical protein
MLERRPSPLGEPPQFRDIAGSLGQEIMGGHGQCEQAHLWPFLDARHGAILVQSPS